MNNYELVIGMEIHAELNTDSKIFCGCRNQFGSAPNTLVCPVCMGLPGALPRLNRQAFEDTIRVGLLFNCEIADVAIFERKNYFYPDLAKSYQVSQFSSPICSGGGITLDNGKYIRFNRIHLEEDAGKLIHDSVKNVSLVDYNRAGVPLVEMVTEPDFNSSDEVLEFMNKLRMALVYAGVADCRMEEGGMRFDVNMSIRKVDSENLGTRVELKNLNSFKSLSSAIEWEKNRQITLLENGEEVVQETRGYDVVTGETYLMRVKENSVDYRYFPDPDIPQVRIDKQLIAKLQKDKKETFAEKSLRYRQMGLNNYDCNILLSDKNISEYFDEVVVITNKPKETANWIISEVLHYIKDGYNNLKHALSSQSLGEIINFLLEDKITRTSAKVLLENVIATGKPVKTCLKELGLDSSVDLSDVASIIENEISHRYGIVDDYLTKPGDVENYIIGIVNQQTNGRVSIANIKLTLASVIEKALV